MTPVKNQINVMKKFFSQSGLKPDKEQENRFFRLYQMLRQYNEELDLSRLKSDEDIFIKHFVDSVYFAKFTDLPSSLVDIGTGPGFPGIPLKIMHPEVNIILAEPRHKRVYFMEKVIKELGLSGISIYPHLVTEKSFFEVNGVITRALESADETLSRVKHFLPENGRIILLKGPEADKDLKTLSEKNRSDYEMTENVPYTLPETSYNRRLIVFRKTVSSMVKTFRIFHNPEETTGFPITSKENKKFKEFKKLTSADKIKKSGKVIVSGKKIIKDMLELSPRNNRELIIFDEYAEADQEFENIISAFSESKELFILKKSLFNELDLFKTSCPLLVTDIPESEDWIPSEVSGCSLIVPFQDPANVGTVIRSAAGFGVKNIIMLKESANPFHPKSIRSSAGSVFSVNIKKGPSLGSLNKIIMKNEISLVSLDKEGTDINDFTFPENFLLLPGIEGPGLPDEFKNMSVSIPLDKGIESLNAAIAASIALFEWKKRS